MKILIAIELIVGAIFVVAFWNKNPELILSRYSSRYLLNPYDDEEADMSMEDLDRIFDQKQFALDFRTANGESSSRPWKHRTEVTAHSKREAAFVGAKLSKDRGVEPVVLEDS